jgi:hypothetical protein
MCVFCRLVVGESGQSWQAKIDAARGEGAPKRESRQPRVAIFSTSPDLSGGVWLKVQGLLHPEITARIFVASLKQGAKQKKSMTLAEDVVEGSSMPLCEATLPLPTMRSSGGIRRAHLDLCGRGDNSGTGDGGSLAYLWERPVQADQKALAARDLETLASGSSGLQRLAERKIRVTLPPGEPLKCRLDKGFMGAGCRVTAFSTGNDGQPGRLEQEGVKIGMFLNGFDRCPEIASIAYVDCVKILQIHSRRERSLVFSTRPAADALKAGAVLAFGRRMFDLNRDRSPDEAATQIQKAFRMWRQRREETAVWDAMDENTMWGDEDSNDDGDDDMLWI